MNNISKNYEKIRKINMFFEVLKIVSVGVDTTRIADGFAPAFRRCPERCEKCVAMRGNYVQKTLKKNSAKTLSVFLLFKFSGLFLTPLRRYRTGTF